jgi:hypothetical protein
MSADQTETTEHHDAAWPPYLLAMAFCLLGLVTIALTVLLDVSPSWCVIPLLGAVLSGLYMIWKSAGAAP